MAKKKQRKKRSRSQKNPQTPTLALCMIAKDEASFLGACLRSVKSLVDEIVVGDTGSSDETAAVAERAGARVISVPWAGDFAAARNAVLDAAKSDWILVLDCDEVLAKRDHRAIRKAILSGKAAGFRMTTRNYAQQANRVGWIACDGAYAEERDYPGWFPSTKVRLFVNEARIRFAGAVHELVEGAIEAMGGKLADLGVPVHHYGYVEKARPDQAYAEAAKKKADGQPDDPEALYQLALSLRDAGDLTGAQAAISRCVALVKKDGVPHGHYLRPDFVYLVQADILGRLEDREGERLACLNALKVNPECFQALNNLGTHAMRTGNLEEARARYESALALAPDDATIRENVRRVNARIAQRSASEGSEPQLEAPRDGGRLTLCMIAGNEGHRLGRCLESVQGLVDEIVVVDTGSTDDTVAVAERFGARMGCFEWCDDFAAARNASLALATGDWIMWLDPDDILPRECHAKIRDAMRRGLGKKVAYYWVLDDQGYEPVTCLQMRLFPNLPGVKFTMPIHEQVTPSLADLGVRCEATDIRVAHTGYATPEIVEQKQVRYLGIMERWLQTHPDDYIVRSHKAMTHYIRGQLDDAIENYQSILDDGFAHADRNLVIETTAMLYLGRSHMRRKDYERALPFLLNAQKLDDQYAVTNLTLGECYTRMNRHADALTALDRALAFENQVTFAATDMKAVRYATRFFKGQNLEALGRFDEAIDWYQQAAAGDVTRGDALGRLSGVYRRLGRMDEAVAAIDEALARDPGNAQHQFNRGTFYLASGNEEEAVRWFERAMATDPDMPEPYLNLGYVARRNGDPVTAERMYRRAIDLSSESYEAYANLGHLLLDQERWADAADAFGQVQIRQPGLLDVALGLCVCQVALGDLHAVRGLVGEALGAVYGQSLPMGVPENATGADLAMLLAECGRMLVQQQQGVCAQLAYLAAHRLHDQAPDIAMQLAEIYRVLGDPWKAVSIYEEQIRHRPNDSELFEKLGACYDAMGVPEAAKLCLEQVARLTA